MLYSILAQATQVVPSTVWYEEKWFLFVSALLILVLPYFFGERLARSLRMPDYGWKLGLIFIAIVAGCVIDVFRWPPRLGIDLQGGVRLVYQLDQSKLREVNVDKLIAAIAAEAQKAGFGSKKVEVRSLSEGQIELFLPTDDAAKVQTVQAGIDGINPKLNENLAVRLKFISSTPGNGGTLLVYSAEHDVKRIEMDRLTKAVVKRVNPGGQQEVAVRSVGGDQIEVSIPKVDSAELEKIKKKIATAGALEFRIVADQRLYTLPEFHEAIDAARASIDSPSNDVSNGQKVVAQWVTLATPRSGPAQLITRQMKGKTQVLVLKDDYDVTGSFLTNASSGVDEGGRPEVRFAFNSQGAQRFSEFTGSNLKDEANGIEHELGIVLDGELRSMAGIQSRISDSGRITGDFKQADVELIVDVLNAGSLPAALQKEPLSEDTISAELGADTIQSSYLSMGIATALVLVFMLFYYRFAGMVANMAVILNLVLVLALMIVFKAAFTLAGLAGLVLSVGMAVDSNVLIYERMREEKERGAALRMVIRNGFGRAMATIIDTHSTTIITGVILFAIGTEQLRGFAVTLVMGLVVNLFTAVFCARVVFDIAERKRWLTELKMLKLFGETHIDFVRIMKPAIIVSILISIAGLVAVWHRGSTILDVDFTGGSEVQIALDPAHKMDVSEVRKVLESPSVAADLPDVTVNAVTSAKVENTQFVIRTSNDDIKKVKAKLVEVFADRLRHYQPAKPSALKVIEAKAPSPSETKPTTTGTSTSTTTTRAATSTTQPATTTTQPPATTTTSKPPDESKNAGAGKNEPPAGGADKLKEDAKPADATVPPEKKPPPADASPKKDDKAEPPKASLARPFFDQRLLALVHPGLLVADDPPAAKSDDKAPAKSDDAPKDKADEKPAATDPKTDSKTAAKADEPPKDAGDKSAADKNPPPAPGDSPKPTTSTTTAPAPATTTTGAAGATTTTGAAATSTTGTTKPSDASTSSTRFPPPEATGGKSDFLTRPGIAAAAPETFVGGTEVRLTFPDKINYDNLRELLEAATAGKPIRYDLSNDQYSSSDNHGYSEWTLKLAVPPSEAQPIVDAVNAKLTATPIFLSASQIGSRVAGDMQKTAITALVVSIIMIVLYIWIRFQNVIYGIGAVVALIHDVLVTVAGVALSYYVAGFLGFLLVDPFKISLNVVAAMLTIVGYSISDTIVIFDRIREVRGKSPDLTEEMINKSVNQTLSRTVLTVFTVLLVTIILYIAGGQAIHAFAFTMLIGLISGTYSSVYIAAPFLLWLKLPSGQNGK